MKIHVALFFGDITDIEPVVGRTLEGCLHNVQLRTGFGWANCKLDPDGIKTPDPEDDKIEVWEFDAETGTSKIVWGFWGWHHTIPHDLEQGTMPGNSKSLYMIAMDE